jgi:hypothetical protein
VRTPVAQFLCLLLFVAVLTPGTYRVVVGPVRLPSKEKQEKKESQIEVAAGKTAEWIVDFAQ